MEVPGVETDDLVERDVERTRLVLEVVVADEDQSRLDAQRLDRCQPVRGSARTRERAPQARGVLRPAEDLVSELTRIPGARDPNRNPAYAHLLGEETEIAQRVHIGVAERREQVARARALELDVR